MPTGRPTKYNKGICDKILARMADGDSLSKICAEDWAPAPRTVYYWLFNHKDFLQRYEHARAWQAETLVAQITHIADTPQMGTVTIHKSDGRKEVREADMTEHRKLQVQAREWVAARLLPKKYGDKVEQTHRGDPDAPVTFVVSPNAAKW